VSGSCYLNVFRPLAKTPNGRNAIKQHSLPPFIDASCRREPDLESQLPFVSVTVLANTIRAVYAQKYFQLFRGQTANSHF
jgi:hypothetical protein